VGFDDQRSGAVSKGTDTNGAISFADRFEHRVPQVFPEIRIVADCSECIVHDHDGGVVSHNLILVPSPTLGCERIGLEPRKKSIALFGGFNLESYLDAIVAIFVFRSAITSQGAEPSSV
jgi:hypothetical protein